MGASFSTQECIESNDFLGISLKFEFVECNSWSQCNLLKSEDFWKTFESLHITFLFHCLQHEVLSRMFVLCKELLDPVLKKFP